MSMGEVIMQWAIVAGERFEANPILKGVTAKCPCCDSEVRPKCGSIVEWHWAHKERDCDPWSEPESQWHRDWKDSFPSSWNEVIIGNHRADIKAGNLVIELQNSLISPQTIQDRESFYGNMIWIVNASDFALSIREQDDYVSFRWKWPRKSWWNSTRPIYFDLGFKGILEVRKIYNEVPCGGWGHLFPARSEFLKRIGIVSEKQFSEYWTNDPETIRNAIRGIATETPTSDDLLLALYAGGEFSDIITSGTCNRWNRFAKTYINGSWHETRPKVCGGELEVTRFKRGGAEYIRCKNCKMSPIFQGEDIPGLHPRIAEICKRIFRSSKSGAFS